MSYDIYLKIDTGSGDVIVYDWNFTSNTAPMWRAAGVDLAEHDGKKAADVTPELEAAVRELEANPEKYRAMSSPNGWGTYEQLLPHLRDLLDAYRRHLLTTVEVSR